MVSLLNKYLVPGLAGIAGVLLLVVIFLSLNLHTKNKELELKQVQLDAAHSTIRNNNAAFKQLQDEKELNEGLLIELAEQNKLTDNVTRTEIQRIEKQTTGRASPAVVCAITGKCL